MQSNNFLKNILGLNSNLFIWLIYFIYLFRSRICVWCHHFKSLRGDIGGWQKHENTCTQRYQSSCRSPTRKVIWKPKSKITIKALGYLSIFC